MTEAIPQRTMLNRWRQRRFVGAQHRRDMANQRTIGFDTFAKDWERLLARPRPVEPQVERTVWMLWLQGEAKAPPLVRHCLDSWRERNPGWSIRMLDEDAAFDLTGLPDMPRRVEPNHLANLIRLRLLSRHGGIWTDATTLCRRPLDGWIDAAAASGFFAFARPQPVRALANWFIAALPADPLLQAWRLWSEDYVLSGKRVQSYFWSHHTFDWLLHSSPTLAARWEEVPKISARGPHILQRLLDHHVTAEDTSFGATFSQVPLFKLNWKKGYTLEAIRKTIGDNSLT